MTQFNTTGDNSYGSPENNFSKDASQNYPTQQENSNAPSQDKAQGVDSVPATGGQDSQSGEGSRKVPKVLLDLPPLEGDAQELHARHRANRIPPNSGLEKQLVAKHDGLMKYYEFMAKIDPSSATFSPPAHDLVPMPRGGLDALVINHLGPRPVIDEYADKNERADAVSKQQKWDVDFANYRNILFRLNSDTLRTENRYAMGQSVRVPYELADDNRE